LRDPAVGPDQFRRDLKTHLFEWHCISFSALAVFSRNALYKSTFYLLTYLLPVAHNWRVLQDAWHAVMLHATWLNVRPITSQDALGSYNITDCHLCFIRISYALSLFV